LYNRRIITVLFARGLPRAGGGEVITHAETDDVVEDVMAIMRSAQAVARTSLYLYVKFYRMFPEIVDSARGRSSMLVSHLCDLIKKDRSRTPS
jgi:hypothetical protein